MTAVCETNSNKAHVPVQKSPHPNQVKQSENHPIEAEAKNGASKEKPILLRIETKAGHGQGKPVTKQIEENTDMYSFLFWQLGVKP